MASKVAVHSTDWSGRYHSTAREALIYSHDLIKGEILIVSFPDAGAGEYTKPEIVHRFHVKFDPEKFSSGQEFFVEKFVDNCNVEGGKILKKIEFIPSMENPQGFQYIITEFKLETDFFDIIPPDDLSKLVRTTELTFYKQEGVATIDLKLLEGPDNVIQRKLVLTGGPTTVGTWRTKMKHLLPLENPDKQAASLFLQYRQEAWGLVDGQLVGSLQQFEASQIKDYKHYNHYYTKHKVRGDAQVVGERY